MFYVGIDIGKRFHVMGAIGELGEELSPPQKFDSGSTGLNELNDKIRLLADVYGNAVLGLEATGHYWYVPYRYFTSKGYKVYCLNPRKTQALRMLRGHEKTKTDDIDCLSIAEILRIGNLSDSTPLDPDLLGFKQLIRTRYMLVSNNAKAKMRIKNLLDQVFPEYESHFSSIYNKGSMAILKRCATPKSLLQTPFDELNAYVKDATHKRFKNGKLEEIIADAKSSCGICFADDYYDMQIKLLVNHVEFTQGLIDEIDKIVSSYISEKHPNLLSIPGVGTISIGNIVAEIGDTRRFKQVSSLVSYAGLAPSVHQSGTSINSESHITKNGPGTLRSTLYYAALASIKQPGKLQDYYRKKRQEGMHAKEALVILSRKLLVIIFSMMKSGEEYRSWD